MPQNSNALSMSVGADNDDIDFVAASHLEHQGTDHRKKIDGIADHEQGTE